MTTHGGKRKGAGRPPLKVNRFYITLTSDQIEWLKAQGNASRTIRTLIEKELKISAYFYVGKFTCVCGWAIGVSAQEDENLVRLKFSTIPAVELNIGEEEPHCPNCGQSIDFEIREVLANIEQ
ncbi:MAG: hypothetical protein ACYC5K_02345 [Saccharofermentanales bacterium]